MNRNVLSSLILSVFVGLPLLFFFQNCGGGTGMRLVYNPRGTLSTNPKPFNVSGSLVAGGGADVVNFDFAASDTRVVFMADKETDDLVELYAANRDGTGLSKLSGGGFVESFQINGGTVLYIAEETAGTSELFQIGVDGMARVNLSGPLVAGGQVRRFQITPDGLHAVFLADKDTLGVPEIYSVALVSPGPPVKLHPALASGRQIKDFKALDGKILFSGNAVAASQVQLFSANHDGTLFTAISAADSAGGQGVVKFDSNADASVVVYQADLDTLGLRELYLTSADGTGQTKISHATPGGPVMDFQITTSGSHAVFLGDLNGEGTQDLFERDLATLAPIAKLNPQLAGGGNVTRFQVFNHVEMLSGAPIVQPGVAFIADQALNDKFELFLTKDLAQTATRMSGTMNPAGDIFDFAISLDGQQLVYVADQEIDGRYELYVKPTDNSVAEKRAAGVNSQDVLPPIGFAPDNVNVFFVGDLNKQNQRELYVTATGQTMKVISDARADESDVFSFKLSSDGKWILFAGDQDTNGVDELYLAPVPDL